MASTAARAYDYYAPQRAPRRESRVGVVRGIPRETISPSALRMAKFVILGIAIFAVRAVVRIGLTTATVNTMIESQSLSAQIEDLSSTNAALSVQKSVLSSPTAVKERATALGMVAKEPSEILTLAPDVVAYDGAGNLSLSASLARAL